MIPNFDEEREKANELMNNKVVKYAFVGAVLFVGLYASSYLMRASSKAVLSYKELKNAIRN